MKTYLSILTNPLLFILFLSPLLLMAGQKTSRKNEIIIEGKTDSAYKVDLVIASKLMDLINKFSTSRSITIKDGRFSFHIPGLQDPTNTRLIFYYSNGKRFVLDNYLAEPGDSVYIQQTKKAAAFFGRSRQNFICQFQISQIKRPSGITDSDKADLYKESEKRVKTIDSCYQLKKAVLDGYEGRLSERMYRLLLTEIYYEKKQSEYTLAKSYLSSSRDSIQKSAVIRYYTDHYLSDQLDTTVSNLKLYSKFYIEYVLTKLELDCITRFLQNPAIRLSRSDIKNAVYHEIVQHRNNLLKQKILTSFFAKKTVITDSVSKQIEETAKKITDPALLEIITIIQRRTKGAKAFEFSLPDSKGKIIRLTDFRGKVVVLDFWYTGCGACPGMASVIKPIAQKKDSNVVFITISIDKDKKTWLESLQSGEYSSDDEINLYTENQGDKSEIIRHYRILGYPMVIVITRLGKIYAVDPLYDFFIMSKMDRISSLEKSIADAMKEE